MSTAIISEPISGDKAYQVRARAALPLLVRQAEAGAPVFYSDLAEELGMPNPRNLNYVLGSIGQSLERLSEAWKVKVPPIQCLVVNKKTGLPGEGIGWFLVKKEDFATLPLKQKRAIVEAELQHVFSYPRWQEVLKALELEPAISDFTRKIGDRWLKLQSLENFLPSWIGEHMLKFCFDDCSLLFKRERCKIFLLDEKPTDTLSR